MPVNHHQQLTLLANLFIILSMICLFWCISVFLFSQSPLFALMFSISFILFLSRCIICVPCLEACIIYIYHLICFHVIFTSYINLCFKYTAIRLISCSDIHVCRFSLLYTSSSINYVLNPLSHTL